MVSLKVDTAFGKDRFMGQLLAVAIIKDQGQGCITIFDHVVDAGSDEELVPCCYNWIFQMRYIRIIWNRSSDG